METNFSRGGKNLDLLLVTKVSNSFQDSVFGHLNEAACLARLRLQVVHPFQTKTLKFETSVKRTIIQLGTMN